MTEPLTGLQKRYIWLAGQHPGCVVQQGRGVRGLPTYYAFDGDVLFLFGYSAPLHHMKARGIFRQLQDGRSHVLTEKGESMFQQLLRSSYGDTAERETKLAKVKTGT